VAAGRLDEYRGAEAGLGNRPELTGPPPWISPLALTPPASLAFRCGAWILLLTVSGTADTDDENLSDPPQKSLVRRLSRSLWR
jgi:hypothetical protein